MAANKVITVTLTPSLDRTLVVHYLGVGYQNRTIQPSQLDPAGRGVNIARALRKLGTPTHAVILLGKDATSQAYQALVKSEGFPVEISLIEGKTRSVITVLDTGNQNETVIIEENAEVKPIDLESIGALVEKLYQPGDVVVFADNLPEGSLTDSYAEQIKRAKMLGAKVVINHIDHEHVRAALSASPHLVALQQNQVETLFNFPVRSEEDVVYCASQLLSDGANMVMTTFTEGGRLMLTTPAGSYLAQFEETGKGTMSGTTGAKIAAFLSAELAEASIEDCLKQAAAAAAFTHSQAGNVFGTPDDLAPFMENITVQAL